MGNNFDIISTLNDNLVKKAQPITQGFQGFNTGDFLNSTASHLYRSCSVFILKQPKVYDTSLRDFVKEFDEFKGRFVILKNESPSGYNPKFLDLVALPVIDSYRPCIAFPITFTQEQGHLDRGGEVPLEFSDFSKKSIQWDSSVGDVVTITGNNSTMQASTVTVVFKNNLDKYLRRAEFLDSDDWFDRGEKLEKRGKCVFEPNDVVVVYLPTLDNRLLISFTGYVNKILNTGTPVNNTITLVCEDVTKKLRYSRSCSKKAVVDLDPDTKFVPFNAFTIPWLDSTAIKDSPQGDIDTKVIKLDELKGLLQKLIQEGKVGTSEFKQLNESIVRSQEIVNNLVEAGTVKNQTMTPTMDVILTVLSLLYCNGLNVQKTKQSIETLYRVFDGSTVDSNKYTNEIEDLNKRILKLQEFLKLNTAFLRSAVGDKLKMFSDIQKISTHYDQKSGFSDSELEQTYNDDSLFVTRFLDKNVIQISGGPIKTVVADVTPLSWDIYKNGYLSNLSGSYKTNLRMQKRVNNVREDSVVIINKIEGLEVERERLQQKKNVLVDDIRKQTQEYIQSLISELKSLKYRHCVNGRWYLTKDVEYLGASIPVAVVSGTDQQAFTFTYLQAYPYQFSEWEENHKMLSGWAKNLNYDFYADEYGVVRIQPTNVEIKDTLNNAEKPIADAYRIIPEKVISYEESADSTDFVTSAYITGALPYGNIQVEDFKPWIGFYEDERTKRDFGYGKQVRETVVGLMGARGCQTYAELYVEKYNKTRIRKATLQIIGDSSIRIGNWVYVPSYNVIGYVSNITYSITPSNYKMTLSLIYIRRPILENVKNNLSAIDFENRPSNRVKASTVVQKLFALGYPKSICASINQHVVDEQLTHDGKVWEPVVNIEWDKVHVDERTQAYVDNVKGLYTLLDSYSRAVSATYVSLQSTMTSDEVNTSLKNIPDFDTYKVLVNAKVVDSGSSLVDTKTKVMTWASKNFKI